MIHTGEFVFELIVFVSAQVTNTNLQCGIVSFANQNNFNIVGCAFFVPVIKQFHKTAIQ